MLTQMYKINEINTKNKANNRKLQVQVRTKPTRLMKTCGNKKNKLDKHNMAGTETSFDYQILLGKFLV